MEYPKEYWIDNKCRYWLREIESCRKCLFETLCHLEKDTLNNNTNTNENATTEIIND